MIKRLGIVIWWLGAITIGIACFTLANSISNASQCKEIFAQLAQVNTKVQAIMEHAPSVTAQDASAGSAIAKKGSIDWDAVNAETKRKNATSRPWKNDPWFGGNGTSEPLPDASAPEADETTQHTAQSEDPILKALSQANAIPRELSEKQQELTKKSEACSPHADYFTAFILAAAGIAMWAISFILTGRFFRPAKLP